MDTVLIREATGTATASKGRLLLQFITAGEGTSGDYLPEVLEAAARDRVAPKGTHCYIDHAAAYRRGPNGERSIRDLVCVTDEDARYDPATQALVAEATLVGADSEMVKEIAPYIGVSISGAAVIGPPREPGRQPVVKRITALESVDFVSRAGRGGAILQILESAGLRTLTEATSSDREDQLSRVVRDSYHRPDQDQWAHVRDFDETRRLVWYRVDDTLWQESWAPTSDDHAVTLTGGRIEVRAVTQYIPVTGDQGSDATESAQPNPKEAAVANIDEAELAQLRAQAAQAATLESERDAAITERDELRTRQAVEAARTQARTHVLEATAGEHPALTERVATQIVEAITGPDLPADLDQQIAAAVEAEKAYLKQLTESRPLQGFGASTPATTHTPRRTRNAFGREIKEA